jgi:hypothetical protein
MTAAATKFASPPQRPFANPVPCAHKLRPLKNASAMQTSTKLPFQQNVARLTSTKTKRNLDMFTRPDPDGYLQVLS